VSDFDDQLKSATKGYASFSYRHGEYQSADVVKVDILVASARVPGLSRFLPRAVFEREARQMLGRLKELLPRQQFTQALQASAEGRIIARDDIQALKKDVTGYLYGGDRTRKMKLWKKQKRGKERLKERGEVSISPSVFKELLKK
ncbi:MAG: elongation factor 4, partial [Candidatus Jorgensenbacteria bacterium]|nr:elongation factor 4 [Candidatus Jorgensenbacteria bacterium]